MLSSIWTFNILPKLQEKSNSCTHFKNQQAGCSVVYEAWRSLWRAGARLCRPVSSLLLCKVLYPYLYSVASYLCR